MAKDPAFLFYYQDFLVGTDLMSNEETGAYIRLLCHLADKGRLCEKDMQSICRGYAFSGRLKDKFSVDKDGYFFNERLHLEVQKRRNYTESRRKNAKAYALHMENENENENENKDTKRSQSKKFIPPTVDEVRAYCKERKNKVDPEAFVNFYESKGWMVGKNKMKSWPAAVRTWEKNGFNKPDVPKPSYHEPFKTPKWMEEPISNDPKIKELTKGIGK